MGTGVPRIDRITIWAIDLPLRRPFTSATVAVASRRLGIVRIEAAGLAGWGEAAPVPGHTEDFAVTWAELSRAINDPIAGVTSIQPGLARAACEQALTDLAARREGRPLWEYLGASQPVHASAAIGIDANHQPDGEAIAVAVAGGYRHMKLKIDAATDLAELRRTLIDYPGISFGADANESLADCDRRQLRAIDRLGLAFLEQPGRATDLDWHRTLRAEIDTPLALDESAASAEGIHSLSATGAADIVTLKAGRFGTATTLRLAEEAIAYGLRARLGGLLESGIGRAHSVALAGRREFSVVGDIGASDLYFIDDLVDPPWQMNNGLLEQPTTPGIGVEIDEALLARHAFDSLSAE